MDDRRKFTRYDCSFKVCYATSDDLAYVEGSTIAKNISRGGLRLLVSRMIKRGHRLKLKIFTPDEDKTIEATAKVKWINEGLATYSPMIDAGVQFTRASPSEVDRLLATVR